MGGIQAFQWGASYPDMVERIAPFAGVAKTWPQTYVVLEGMKATHSIVGSNTSKLDQLTSADMPLAVSMRDGEYLKRFTERKFIVSWDLTHWRICGWFWEESFMQMDPHNVWPCYGQGGHAGILVQTPLITEISIRRSEASKHLRV